MSMLLKPEALSRTARRNFAKNAETVRSQLLGLPKRPVQATKATCKEIVSWGTGLKASLPSGHCAVVIAIS